MGRKSCHSKKMINEWIKDVNVEIWNQQEVKDFGAYGPHPTYITNLLYLS